MADKSHTTNLTETERHHDDDPFVALWAKREPANAEYNAIGSVHGSAVPGSDGYKESGEAAKAAFRRLRAIDQEIAECVATTPFGLVTKLRIVWEQAGIDSGLDLDATDDADLQVEHLLLKGALYYAEMQVDTTLPSVDDDDGAARRRDERLFVAIEQSMALVRRYLDQRDRTRAMRASVDPIDGSASHRSHEEAQALWDRSGLRTMYDDLSEFDLRARASAWVAFRIYARTLEGLKGKVAFDEFLTENIDGGDLETWTYTDEWPHDQLSEDIAAIMMETKKRATA